VYCHYHTAIAISKISLSKSLQRWCLLFVTAEGNNFQQGGLGKYAISCYETRGSMADTWFPGGFCRKWFVKYALDNFY
jgi:hypothetical protein